MKKVSTVAAKPSKKISQQKLTVGLDLGDRNSWYCVLDESGQIQLEQRVRTNEKGFREIFGAMPHSRIALTFLLTLEDPHRFHKSRDLGCYLGLQPGRRNSGQSEPQMHISKEGDPYLRTLLVQGAQHILGPFGMDCDLRRWGLKLAERGGKSGKKRAIIATARKLAVLLHHLWVSGEVYEPLHNSHPAAMPAAA
jgi:hypothetical protein